MLQTLLQTWQMKIRFKKKVECSLGSSCFMKQVVIEREALNQTSDVSGFEVKAVS